MIMRCNKCYFKDECEHKWNCDYFTPIDETDDDIYGRIVQRDRAEYREAWYEYINEFEG